MSIETEVRSPPGSPPEEPTLRRSIGPFQMTLYGLGSMLGSGIYGLTSLGSRYPRAGAPPT